ncbi:MAG: threonine/serine exporter family protein [Huintestinicola sp.]
MNITEQIVIPLICSFIACCAFGVQFNIRLKHLIAASVGSVVSQLLYSLLTLYDTSEPVCYFVAASAVTVYSEIMARRLKAPVNMYLILGIIPLVPGGLSYDAMLALVAGNRDLFFDKLINVFAIAGSIAMGIFAVSSFVRIFTGFSRKHIHLHKQNPPKGVTSK